MSYKLLGTRQWFVIHHTNRGMEFFTNEMMRGLLASSLETAAFTHKAFRMSKRVGSRAGEFIEWLTIRDQEQSVRDNVQRIREHPLVPKNIAIYGYVASGGRGGLIANTESGWRVEVQLP